MKNIFLGGKQKWCHLSHNQRLHGNHPPFNKGGPGKLQKKNAIWAGTFWFDKELYIRSRGATVPGKPGNSGKTGFFKILPGKP